MNDSSHPSGANGPTGPTKPTGSAKPTGAAISAGSAKPASSANPAGPASTAKPAKEKGGPPPLTGTPEAYDAYAKGGATDRDGDAMNSSTPGQSDASYASFSTAKYLSWGSLVLIFLAGFALSIVIANQARQTLLAKQQEFGQLLAQNLNHQIYRRFILPTLVGFGRVELQDDAQYRRLESVINSTIHGLQMQELRIYDTDATISYSTDREVVGRTNMMSPEVRHVLEGGEPIFAVGKREDVPFWSTYIIDPEPGSVVMKMTYPLRIDPDLGDNVANGTLVGVLEITQDIAGVFRTVLRFQWIILLTSLGISLILFLVLLMLIRRADKANAQRLEETQRLQRELHQNEKLASMGRTVASIAHEIRNPLGIIRSSAELLLKKQQDASSLHARILQAIYDESKRLSQTVQDFLDYARPKPPKQDRVDLTAVIEQVQVFLEHECQQQGVQVTRDTPAGLVLLGDKDLLYRAFYNIVSNSLQAMEGPGEIRITSRRMGRNGMTLETTVQDSGPGFQPEMLEKLTDPFVTTKDHGTGLGLAITKGIIHSHGGSLLLDNAPGGGARTIILLPARQEKA